MIQERVEHLENVRDELVETNGRLIDKMEDYDELCLLVEKLSIRNKELMEAIARQGKVNNDLIEAAERQQELLNRKVSTLDNGLRAAVWSLAIGTWIGASVMWLAVSVSVLNGVEKIWAGF